MLGTKLFFHFLRNFELLFPAVKNVYLAFHFIMVFSPGQNGKGDKSNQNGKLKKNAFFKRKGGEKNRKSPSFNKEKLTVQPSVKRNEYRKTLQKEHLTHHQLPRSPQRRSKIEAAEEKVVPAEEVVLPHTVSLVTEPFSSVSLVAVSPVAEPLSSVSLVTEEVMPRALRSSEKTVRKNDGKYTPSFLKRRRVAGPQQSPEAHQD